MKTLYKFQIIFIATLSLLAFRSSLPAQVLYWQSAPPYPGDGRTFQHVFTLNDKAYVGGGATVSNTILSKQLWEFDHVNNQWTQKGNPRFSPRFGAFAFSIAGYGYVGSGNNGGSGYFTDFWRYDPTLDTWHQMQDLPTMMRGRIEPAVIVLNNKAYVVGGVNSGGNPSDVWEYSPGAGGTQGIWTQLATSGPNPFAISGYVEGFGVDPTGGNQGYLYVGVAGWSGSCSNGFWRFDIQTQTWTAMSTYPFSSLIPSRTWTTGGTMLGQTILGIPNAIGFVGVGSACHSPNAPQPTIYAFEPPNAGLPMGNWVQFPANNLFNFPVSLNNGRTFVVGNNIYIGFRYDDSTTGNQMWRIAQERVDTTQPKECPRGLQEVSLVGKVDSVCCRGTLQISNLIPGQSPIKEISIQVTGGQLQELTISGSCGNPTQATVAPALPTPGTTITFLPSCNVSPFNIGFEADPASSLPITLLVLVKHDDLTVCSTAVTFNCKPVDSRCDSIVCKPGTFVPNNPPGPNLGSSRYFQVFNKRTIPICRIELEYNTISSAIPTNANYTPHFAGSSGPQRLFSGSSVAHHQLTPLNSGNPNNISFPSGGLQPFGLTEFRQIPSPFADGAHRRIAPPGNPLPADPINFSLHIAYQWAWVGKVKVKVIHCDSSICEQEWKWCALPNWKACPVEAGTLGDLGDIGTVGNPTGTRRFGDMFTLSRRPELGVVRSIGFYVLMEDTGQVTLRSLGVDEAKVSGSTRVSEYSAFIDLGHVAPDEPDAFTATLTADSRKSDAKEVEIMVVYYDEKVQPLATGKVRLQTVISSVEGSEGRDEHPRPILYPPVPNPTTGDVLIRYRQPAQERVSLKIYNLIGEVVAEIPITSEAAGYHEIPFNVRGFAKGTYSVRLTTIIGVSTVQMIVAP